MTSVKLSNGTITITKNGTFQVDIYIDGVEKRRSFKKEEDAKLFLKAIHKEGKFFEPNRNYKGYIRKSPHANSYEANISVNKKRHTKNFKTKEEAEQWLDQVRKTKKIIKAKKPYDIYPFELNSLGRVNCLVCEKSLKIKSYYAHKKHHLHLEALRKKSKDELLSKDKI